MRNGRLNAGRWIIPDLKQRQQAPVQQDANRQTIEDLARGGTRCPAGWGKGWKERNGWHSVQAILSRVLNGKLEVCSMGKQSKGDCERGLQTLQSWSTAEQVKICIHNEQGFSWPLPWPTWTSVTQAYAWSRRSENSSKTMVFKVWSTNGERLEGLQNCAYFRNTLTFVFFILKFALPVQKQW